MLLISSTVPISSRRRTQAGGVLAWVGVLGLAVASVGWMGASSVTERRPARVVLSAAEQATVDSVQAVFSASLAAREAAFAAVDSLSPREAGRLRRSLNAAHVRTAKRLGVAPVATDSALAFADGLDRLDPSSATYVGRGRLAPDARAALDEIGERFHERLAEAGLPPFRFTVSSTFRTAEHQARLRGVNANASTSTSSHEYGTTFDLAYRRFRPGVAPVKAADRPTIPDTLSVPAKRALATSLDVAEQLWAERAAVRHADALEAELGRALIDLEDEGVLLALREVRQPCFHVTVARRLAGA